MQGRREMIGPTFWSLLLKNSVAPSAAHLFLLRSVSLLVAQCMGICIGVEESVVVLQH